MTGKYLHGWWLSFSGMLGTGLIAYFLSGGWFFMVLTVLLVPSRTTCDLIGFLFYLSLEHSFWFPKSYFASQ